MKDLKKEKHEAKKYGSAPDCRNKWCGVHRSGGASTLPYRTLIVLIFFLSPVLLQAQEGPALHLLSDGEAVHIILHNSPPGTAGFKAYRRGPEDDSYLPLTRRTVKPLTDPYQAYELLKADAPWLERKFDTRDPVRLWRKIEINRNYAFAYSLVSPGLRMALGRTLIDQSVKPGTTYRYRIELVDGDGREIETFQDRITVETPEEVKAPGSVSAEVDGKEVALNWEYAEYRGRKSDLTVGFHIYRREEGAEAVRINQSPVLRVEGFLSYFDSNAVEGVSYRYGVQAVDIIGELSKIVYSDKITIKDTTPPLVPMGLTAVDQTEGVLLIWNLSPEADVRSYNVYRSDSSEGKFKRINSEPIGFDIPQYRDEQMVRGKPWFYKVSAVDASGNESAACGAVTIIPQDSQAPAAVSGLRGTVDPEERAAELSWNPSGEADLKGYYVYRTQGEKGFLRITPSPLPPQKTPEYRDRSAHKKGLLPGAEYRYAVSAVDMSGNESERSEIKVLVPDLEPPHKVFSFSARTSRDGRVELRWQPSLSRDLALHRIYRVKAKQDPQMIAELPAEETSYTDAEVERGQTYIYYIVEVDNAKNSSQASKKRRVMPLDIVEPGQPQDLAIRKKAGRVSLSWSPPADDDVAGYLVYKAAYENAKIHPLTKSLLTATDFIARETSSKSIYYVRALDTSGNEGPAAQISLEEGE